MFYYKLYGLNVQSNIDFPQLFIRKNYLTKNPDVEIVVEDTEKLSKTVSELKKEGQNFGKTYGIWFKNQAGYFTIECRENVSYMKCRKFKDIHISIVRSFLLGNALAVMLTQRNKIVLHGSTLVMGDKTFLVCGDSGAGKSTLSMALQDKGAQMMADDISVIDVDKADGCCYAYSGFPEQKLCRDAAIRQGYDLQKLNYVNEDRDKYSIDSSSIFVEGRRKIDALFALHKSKSMEGDDDVVSFEVTGAEKVNSITDRFFLNVLYGGFLVLSPENMMKCVMLAGQIKIIDMTRNSKANTIDTLTEIVLDNI